MSTDMLMGKSQLEPAWIEAAEEGILPDSMVSEHLEMAEMIGWDYRPEMQYDIHRTLLTRDYERKKHSWDVMRFFQQRGRIITIITKDHLGDMRTALRAVRNTPLAAELKSKFAEDWVRNIQVRAECHEGGPRLMETLFDDSPEQGSPDAFVSYIDPLKLKR